jgi:arginase
LKEIQIIENTSEIGAGTRGASLGIDALKMASLNADSNYFAIYPNLRIESQNHLLFKENDTPNAIHIEGISKVYNSISLAVSNSLKSNHFPLVLAADHASAGGTIAGIKNAFPHKRLGVIWIDAHADLHSPYTSPSGNVHGMPLATAIDDNNLESQINQPSEKAVKLWESLKDCGGVRPKIHPKDLLFFGVRDTEGPERNLMAKRGIRNYRVEECRKIGIEGAVMDALESLKECDLLYISFDVDSMDPDEVSYGTGTPVENGFTPSEVQEIMCLLIEKSNKVACLEFVEVNPLLDKKGNKMAETAFSILEKVTVKLSEFGI